MVLFTLICRLAAKYNMRLVYKQSFHELFNEKNKDYGNLLHKMQALEVRISTSKQKANIFNPFLLPSTEKPFTPSLV